MPNDADTLFIWLLSFVVLAALASIAQALNTPEVREVRAYRRAVQLANEQPARRRSRRMQNVPR